MKQTHIFRFLFLFRFVYMRKIPSCRTANAIRKKHISIKFRQNLFLKYKKPFESFSQKVFLHTRNFNSIFDRLAMQ